jgi:hypothetical protein
MDRDDMRMRQAGGGLCLSGKPLPNFLLKGELRRKYLDGDSALESLIAGPIDYPHAAATDLSLDGEGVSQRCS